MTKKPNYVFDDELYHHGILGQRWGHRRFQNEDGSWTPEGRERYGEGDARSKAKATYETQKYKLNLKSKAQKEKDRRAAKEERVRIKEAAKTQKLIKKEQAKVDQEGRGKAKFRNTKKMSDEELQTAIDRLKLQSEYNKQYALAKKPDGALAKADRFFSGPTGEAVRAMAVAAMPQAMTALGNLANTALTNKLKYANKEDREAAAALNAKTLAEAASFRSKTAFQDAQTKEKLSTISNNNDKAASAMKDAELDRREIMRKANIENAKARIDIQDKKSQIQINRATAASNISNANRQSKAAAASTQAQINSQKNQDQINRATAASNISNANRQSKAAAASTQAQINSQKNQDQISLMTAKTKNKIDRDESKAKIFQMNANSITSISKNVEKKYNSTISKKETSKTINSIELPPWTPGTAAKANALYSSGKTIEEVADEMHVSWANASRMILSDRTGRRGW